MTRTPYAQLGAVEVSKECRCCVSVSTDHVRIRPGCGCNRLLTEEISHELQRLARPRRSKRREDPAVFDGFRFVFLRKSKVFELLSFVSCRTQGGSSASQGTGR